MSHQLGRVVSELLLRYFGEIVEKVGKDLFQYGTKPIGMILKTTGLPRSQVVDSLRTLLKFDLASFEPSANEVIADYKLIPENVLLLIRYPRYLLQMKSKFGSEAELLVEELLQQATCTATVLLVTLANKYKDDKEKNINIVQLKDVFISLATAGYIQQAPVAELKEGSEIPTLVPVATIVPDIDVRNLIQIMNSGTLAEVNDNVYWRINYDRFHQDFRDEIMIKAITRRIDENAGELMKFLLQQMYLTSSPWAPESNPTSALDLKECCRRVASERPLLHQHFDQYLKVLEDSGAGFVRRCGEAGGGQLVVRARRAAAQLVGSLVEHAVQERLGSKAARIFRLIRAKKYIGEEDIQKHAMLPNKECKELTYKLLEEHFISVQPMRKAASAGGMAKAIYLYHVDLHDVAHSTAQMCYAALHNTARRGAHERRQHARLLRKQRRVRTIVHGMRLRHEPQQHIDDTQHRQKHITVHSHIGTSPSHARLLRKQRRVRTIVHGMRLRHEPQQHIDDVEETLTPPERASLASVEARLKQLATAELELDRALFILDWFFAYPR